MVVTVNEARSSIGLGPLEHMDGAIDRVKAERRLGTDVAATLRHRLADLRAAMSIEELIVDKPYPVNKPGHLAIDLADGIRIVFCANHNTIPQASSGDVDWPRVSRIKIFQIEGADE